VYAALAAQISRVSQSCSAQHLLFDKTIPHYRLGSDYITMVVTGKVFLRSINRGVSFVQTGLGGLVLFLQTGDVSE